MRCARSLIGFAFLYAMLSLALPNAAPAGDEDVKDEKKAAVEITPGDTALPAEAEAPELSVGQNQEPAPPPPTFEEIKPTRAAPQARAKFVAKEWDPDENVDYSALLFHVEGTEATRGVLPPAEGFRGYRSNMVAVGAGDRTPGFGGLLEYSWNRIGFGLFGSYMPTTLNSPDEGAYGFAGVYGLYRWLPFDVSPYILMGLEAGFKTDETFGGLTGGGVEARIYSGWTALIGWTFHSTVHRGYLGGAVGWSF